jgi:hypothetical protein
MRRSRVNLRTIVVDAMDPRPVPKATRYALGTFLQGLSVGTVLMVVASPARTLAVWVSGVLFVLGAYLAVTAYSALKRRIQVVGSPAPG